MNRKYLVACTISILVIIICIVFVMILTKTIDNFTSFPSGKPFTINSQNFKNFFQVDTGINNCTDGLLPGWQSTGCPDFSTEYIPAEGEIVWENGQSLTFRTHEPILKNGGFIGFIMNGVPNPMDKTFWNSIWLVGKDQKLECAGQSCVEIDIYEHMWVGTHDGGWWPTPKMSIHDWYQGPNKPATDMGCFGLYLNGSVEGKDCKTKNIITNATVPWQWGDVQDKVYTNASWFAWIGNDQNKKIAIGINLDGWLPESKKEASYDVLKTKADFMIESPPNTIKGSLEGGFYLAVSSTANPDKHPDDGSKYNLGSFQIWDAS